jgi:hypothetical protein
VIGGLAVLLAVTRDPRRWPALAALALAACAYLFATASAHHLGWWTHLWFSTYHMQETLEGFAPAFSLKVYLTAFAYNLMRAITENVWLGFVAVGFVFVVAELAKARKSGAAPSPRLVFVSALLIATIGKFILFPLHDSRTYLPALFPMALIAGAMLAGATPRLGWPRS